MPATQKAYYTTLAALNAAFVYPEPDSNPYGLFVHVSIYGTFAGRVKLQIKRRDQDTWRDIDGAEYSSPVERIVHLRGFLELRAIVSGYSSGTVELEMAPVPEGELALVLDQKGSDISAPLLTETAAGAFADVFRTGITGSRANLIDVQFWKDSPEALLNVLAKTGSANSALEQGHAVFKTGADASVEYHLRSFHKIDYYSFHSLYLAMTPAWVVPPTGVDDRALVGLSVGEDDGFCIGYKGSQFGIAHFRNGSEEAFIPQSGFDDPLDGTGASGFVLDHTKIRVFLLEFGWLGSAPTKFWLQTTDGNIIKFHTIRHDSARPSTTTPALYATVLLRKAASDATDVELRLGCFAGGIVGNVTVSQQPDGEFKPSKADGSAFTNSTPLLASGVFESEWVDTDGWTAMELFIKADQVSASDGIEIEYTEDSNQPSPVVRGSEKFTFTAEDVTRGQLVIRRANIMDGFRVRYTNGGTNQGAFFIAATLRVHPNSIPVNTLESEISDTSPAGMVRSGIFAKNDLGSRALIGRGPLGGFRVSVREHEAETPLKALVGWQTNQANVGTSAVQIVGSPLSGRRTVAIKALAGNNAKVYIGKAGVTTGSGFELNSSEGIILELDDTAAGIYAIAASGTQRVCWAEVGV